MIGQTVSHYEILDKLGEGGMGVVYKALDKRLERTVALKFLPKHLIASDEEKQRLTQEAKAAAALNHPNICTIHNVGEYDDRQFIVMEYIKGSTLRRKLKDVKNWDQNAILTYAVQIIRALKEAHSKGIVHRDIKSENIMVTEDDRIKVMDFGLAKLKGSPQVTKTGNTVGTVTYMSPEQLRGDAVDERSDIWSFGIVLYELLTGRLPFKDDYDHAIMYSILNKDPAPVSTLNSSVSPKLEAVVAKCIEKDPAERYQTAGALLVELNDLLGTDKSVPNDHAKSRNLQHLWSNKRSAVIGSAIIGISAIIILLLAYNSSVVNDEAGIYERIGQESIRLSVLPFNNIGDDPSRQVFCDGLRETITSNLSQFERFTQDLWVVPADEIREMGITSPSEVFKTLGVNYAVTGSLQPIGDQLRLTISLVDAQNRRQIDSEVIDEDANNIPALHDRSVQSVLRMLNVQFEPETRKIIQATHTSVSPALEEYIQGIGYLQRFDRIENIDNAIETFKKAVELDPDFALAYAGLGQAYWRKYEYTRESDWLELASEQAQNALNINSELSQVNITMGIINAEFGRYDEAVKNFNDALANDPANAQAYRELASTYESRGEIDQAVSTMRRSIRLKPDYWSGYNRLGTIYLRDNKFEEAIDQFETVIELTPDNYVGYMNLGVAYFYLGRLEDARSMFEKSLELEKTFDASSNLATIYYAQGRYEQAARLFETALEMGEGNYRLWGNLGSAYFWAPGEEEKAESAFKRAIELAERQKEINPNNPYVTIELAGYQAKIGQEEEAGNNVQKALELAPENTWIMFLAGTTFEQLGDREEALHWIGKAIEHGHSQSEIMNQPDLQDLISDERFQQLLENVK